MTERTADAAPLPSSLAGPTRHRFLSPHYDDIALSCGGAVAALARAGLSPEIAVVFGDEPDPALLLSPFAQALHAQWGLSAGEVIVGRRREEAAAAAALGATSMSLPFPDAIYRGDRYQTNERLFGEPTADEAGLPTEIAASLGLDPPPDPTTRLYAPLAVGGHVDHRHAFAVGLALARAGRDVLFYEDLPYALLPGALAARLAALAPTADLRPAAVVDVDPTWPAKLAAILSYPSQLPSVFAYAGTGDTPAEIAAVIRGYARGVGDAGHAERFWRLS